MNIITFCEIDDSLFNDDHKVEHFHSGVSEKADIIILNIDSIFEFEENKSEVCKVKSVSVAVIDDEEDYDAFKNFGIDAWILNSDLSEINGLLNLLEKRFLV
ncbi:hypothetical protein [Poseidonibacter ostreae]|jgi:hypothetical protein|uniref:Uncharacterized protein n=1 Tax=Poseidonibacter ostreae TaxID=2654171 RepID=A0A6L4WRC5_9BACT|nr:hypothetical protein [Poseidonibacter ostreae]KAB7886907.1 hypothetical protein GA417_03840 [Poseidonibacter ostreae]KAB7887586.1 hypothetical protein GBG19_10495 [Poseidonibacter ostreae]KAB7892199.1 hypothetical protein GBG18_03655 [Poseidonibacter ostreae]